MSMTKEQIFAEAKALDPVDRDALIQELYNLDVDETLDPKQLEELRRRVNDSDANEANTIPGDEVMRRVRAILRQARAS